MTPEKLRLLTRDGVSKLLPVAPDVTCPHPREASDARVGGARQDEGSLPSNLHKSAADGSPPWGEYSVQYKQKPKNSLVHIFCGAYSRLIFNQ